MNRRTLLGVATALGLSATPIRRLSGRAQEASPVPSAGIQLIRWELLLPAPRALERGRYGHG